ncbi:hypothetical protein PAE9249_05129 [Paenibacillus sp. CECT 9249]|uniref:hypothetical protein n=1 Tax=Paenibacillus sp. CECT 9249 TaxID=2845385 RepID=UPI001E402F46|nr:hypothetical protein [Paenibacillus sp. CECT 9249]CAH0122557.1 hypothetical protein PAE9249_05129 [Paenibacillus sp. CECT 9249]
MAEAIRPLVTWYNSTHSQEVVGPYDFEVVDAGDLSKMVTFNIWNNRNGSTDVGKMTECRISTRDMKGGLGDTVDNIVEVVKDNWFHAQVDSLGETDISLPSSRIGKDFEKPVGTTGSTTKNYKGEDLHEPLTPAAQEVLGVNNNGNPQDAAGNFITVSLQAEVPLNASSGRQDFKIRLYYKYT